MRLLFDHNVPHKLRPSLPDDEVSTAEAMGWAVLENGELLQAAEDAGFEIMVTCDQNLSYQQNLRGRKLALVVLSTNNWNLLKRDLSPVIKAVNEAEPGSFQFIKIRPHRQ